MKNRGCLIFIIILLLFIGGLIFGFVEMSKNPERYNTDSVGNYIEMEAEQARKVNAILEQCGIDDVKYVEHDELLDDMDFEGEKGYRVTNGNIKNIILYLDLNNDVYSIRYADKYLYKDGAVVAPLITF